MVNNISNLLLTETTTLVPHVAVSKHNNHKIIIICLAPQGRPPPLGQLRMTAVERELYWNEVCQICEKIGHIAKICWWLSKHLNQGKTYTSPCNAYFE